MKARPLALQIWLISVAITALVFIMLIFFLPWTLRDFFTRQVFDMLKDSQPSVGVVAVRSLTSPTYDSYSMSLPAEDVHRPAGIDYSIIGITSDADGASTLFNDGSMYNGGQFGFLYKMAAARSLGYISLGALAPDATMSMVSFNPPVEEAARALTFEINDKGFIDERYAFSIVPFSSPADLQAVHHLVLGGRFGSFLPDNLPEEFLRQIEDDANSQSEDYYEYQREISDQVLLYVIRKTTIEGEPVYAVSYAWSTYLDSLVNGLYRQLGLLLAAMALLGFLPSLLLARRLSRPLQQMEAQARRIALHDWHTPIDIDRRDEIGSLAQAMEHMRQKLQQQDEAERFMLQSISHELKTPVMVIRSYAQSMLDGIYPRGSSDASIAVIISEAERLEKRVRALLYLNKLNYLQGNAPVSEAEGDACKAGGGEVFDIRALLCECKERFAGLRPELSWDIELEPSLVQGCSDQWRVGLENLLDNQQRYAANRVSVSAVPAKSHGFVLLRVWNDGEQLERTQMETLFQPFAAGPGGEFGLGLVILHKVAELNGGRVWAKNENGGVAFYLQMPRPLGEAGTVKKGWI